MADDVFILDDNQNTPHSSDEIVTKDDGSKTMTLLYPVEVKYRQNGGQERVKEITHLTFRRPNGGDMRATEKITNDQERGFKMFMRLADIQELIFDKLDLTDIEAGLTLIADFLPARPETGQAS